MTPELQRQLLVALERPHRLGTIGGSLEDQLAHCASFSSVLAQVCGFSEAEQETADFLAVDLGTGGGLPGVVLAALWPASQWMLVEMRQARADEVERVILRLGLADRVEVRSCEAQLLGHDDVHREHYDIAVARAFGPPSLTAECASGVVRPGGTALISEPPSDDRQDTEPRWDEDALRALGFSAPAHASSAGYRFAHLVKETTAPERAPRLPARSNRGWYR